MPYETDMQKFVRLVHVKVIDHLDNIVVVLGKLQVAGVLGRNEVEDIKAKSTRHRMAEALMDALVVKDDYIDHFITAVKESTPTPDGRNSFIDFLEKTRNSIRNPTAAGTAGTANVQQQLGQHDAKSFGQPPQPKDTDALPSPALPPPWVGQTISVREGLKIASEEYINEPNRLNGQALIINLDFTNTACERAGSEVDVKQLTKLFEGYKMNVVQKDTLTKQGYQKEFAEFKDIFDTQPANVCIVVIMTHGHRSNVISTSDGHLLEIHRVLEQFNNTNFKAMKGKPKIFLIQACRGDGIDFGVTDSHDLGHKIPSWTDILLGQATVEGQVSFRVPDCGSWFIQTLCTVFRECSDVLEVSDMLKVVAEQMKKTEYIGAKQICTYTNIGFKKFRFPPKI